MIIKKFKYENNYLDFIKQNFNEIEFKDLNFEDLDSEEEERPAKRDILYQEKLQNVYSRLDCLISIGSLTLDTFLNGAGTMCGACTIILSRASAQVL